MGSMNMGNQVFMNTPPHLEEMAISIRDARVTPELEVFEAGHLLLAKRMIETGHIKPPGLFQICLGSSWGQPATPEAVIYMRNLLPPGSIWFAFGISLHQFPIAHRQFFSVATCGSGWRTISTWRKVSSRRAMTHS